MGHGDGIGHIGTQKGPVGHELVAFIAGFLGCVDELQHILIHFLLHALHPHGIGDVGAHLHHGGAQPAGHFQGHSPHGGHHDNGHQKVDDVDLSKELSVFHWYSPFSGFREISVDFWLYIFPSVVQ